MRISSLLLGLVFAAFLVSSSLALAKDLQDLIDLPEEVHDKLKQKLEDSKEYTEEQMETITRCLKKSGVQRIINCLSDDGLEDAMEIGYVIRDEMGNLRDRVCGGSSILEKDRCEKLQNDVKNMGSRIKEKWSKSLAGGKAYFEKKYELTLLKKKICDKIDQKGCWGWLNERLDIHCKPTKLDHNAEKLRQCRLKIAQDVWKRVEARR